MAQVESPVPWVIGPTNHATTAECTNFASVVHNPLSHSAVFRSNPSPVLSSLFCKQR